MKELRGTGIALVTPFTKSGEVDYPAFIPLIELYIESGIDFLVVLGTTAETATLTTDEKQKIAQHLVTIVNGRLPLVYGLGGNNTHGVVNEIKNTDFTGYSALLSVCPYYNKPNQQGIYLHYSAIAEASPIPVILYNVPSRTGVSIANETTISLANDFPNIIGIKDAKGDLVAGNELIKSTPADFLVLSGDDATAFDLTLGGGDGVISVIAGGCPVTFSALINHGLSGEREKGEIIKHQIFPLIDLLFEEGNPTGLKALMHQQNRIQNILRLPLVPASKNLYSMIESIAKNID